MLIYVLISYYMGYQAGIIMPDDFDLNSRNVLGTLGFQLLLSGPSEELLFRALPITILLNLLKENANVKLKYVLSIGIASLLFSLAHITWGLSPLTININWFQVIYAFLLGVIYGVTYIKSKSILYPMLMHSISNVLMVGMGYIFFLVY